MTRVTQNPNENSGSQKTVLLPSYFDINDWDRAINNTTQYDLATEVLDLRAGKQAFQNRITSLDERNQSLEVAAKVLRKRVINAESKLTVLESQEITPQQKLLLLRLLLTNGTSKINPRQQELISEIERLNQARQELAGDLEKSEDESKILDAVIEVRGAEGRAIFRQQQAKITELEKELSEVEFKSIANSPLVRDYLKIILSEVRDLGVKNKTTDKKTMDLVYANIAKIDDLINVVRKNDLILPIGETSRATKELLAAQQKSLKYLKGIALSIAGTVAFGVGISIWKSQKEANVLPTKFSEQQVSDCVNKIEGIAQDQMTSKKWLKTKYSDKGFIVFDSSDLGYGRTEVIANPQCDGIPNSRIIPYRGK